jgi:hypothetical protein
MLDSLILRISYIHNIFRATVLVLLHDQGTISPNALTQFGQSDFREFLMGVLRENSALFYESNHDFLNSISYFSQEV